MLCYAMLCYATMTHVMQVILEGPREQKDAAMAEVMRCMQNPFDGLGLLPLSVKLEVDAKMADTWYKAK